MRDLIRGFSIHLTIFNSPDGGKHSALTDNLFQGFCIVQFNRIPSVQTELGSQCFFPRHRQKYRLHGNSPHSAYAVKQFHARHLVKLEQEFIISRLTGFRIYDLSGQCKGKLPSPHPYRYPILLCTTRQEQRQSSNIYISY